MTDLLDDELSLPASLGVVAEIRDGQFRLTLEPRPEVLRHGALRASVIAFMIDVVAGVVLDDDPVTWSLTSDMSVRMRPVPAPAFLATKSTILRRGRRSATAMVDLATDDGAPVATGAIGFVRVDRRETDPPKPHAGPGNLSTMFDGSRTLSGPLREQAGIVVLDPVGGVLEMPVTPAVRNTAGTLQGAMVALFAEAAAEELVSTRFGISAVVTELDLRYLAQTGEGPVHSECTPLGDGPDAPVQVELSDRSTGRLTTLAYARTAVIRG
jgi:acyl-coenzyme A thioesterase PaaI-like protein